MKDLIWFAIICGVLITITACEKKRPLKSRLTQDQILAVEELPRIQQMIFYECANRVNVSFETCARHSIGSKK